MKLPRDIELLVQDVAKTKDPKKMLEAACLLIRKGYSVHTK
jgi:hypothetical protein